MSDRHTQPEGARERETDTFLGDGDPLAVSEEYADAQLNESARLSMAAGAAYREDQFDDEDPDPVGTLARELFARDWPHSSFPDSGHTRRRYMDLARAALDDPPPPLCDCGAEMGYADDDEGGWACDRCTIGNLYAEVEWLRAAIDLTREAAGELREFAEVEEDWCRASDMFALADRLSRLAAPPKRVSAEETDG